VRRGTEGSGHAGGRRGTWRASQDGQGKDSARGALQVEAKYNKAYNGVKSSDLALTTAEFDFEATWSTGPGELSLQWDSANNTVGLNEGLITIGKATWPVYLKTGQGIVPFGTSIARRGGEVRRVADHYRAADHRDIRSQGGLCTAWLQEVWFQAGAYLYNARRTTACGKTSPNTTAPPLVMG